jgi:cellulose synthase (UDP-forming)
MFCATVWPTVTPPPSFDPRAEPWIDVFVTVAGEPVDLVRQTLQGAKAMDYPKFCIYVLNDGLVTGKPNWKEIEALCAEMDVECITRTVPGGAKAGNINYALSRTTSPYVAIFDADHVPKAQFLKQIVGYFVDDKVAFVQTPQYYRNHPLNITTAAAWQQQALFFDRICRGKATLNSVFMCGTNLIFRRAALAQVGGMFEKNITEDFFTSVLLHQQGWTSVYVPEVLAEGLAPESLSAYARQQFRWARGTLEVVFLYNPFLRKGLTSSQKAQYLASASYWLLGLVVAVNAALPLIYLCAGLAPLEAADVAVMLAFLPYILTITLLLKEMSNSRFRFYGLCFSLAGFPIYIKALLHLLLGFKPRFVVTPKDRQPEPCWLLILPLAAYAVCACIGAIACFLREGLSSALVANSAWAAFYVAMFSPVLAAAWQDRVVRNGSWFARLTASLGRTTNVPGSALQP